MLGGLLVDSLSPHGFEASLMLDDRPLNYLSNYSGEQTKEFTFNLRFEIPIQLLNCCAPLFLVQLIVVLT